MSTPARPSSAPWLGLGLARPRPGSAQPGSARPGSAQPVRARPACFGLGLALPGLARLIC